MPLRFYCLLLLCGVAFSQPLLAQTSFSLTPDTVDAVKPQDIFVMYDYAQFENLSGEGMHMRWVRRSVQVEHGDSISTGLGQWELGVYDPSNVYLHASNLDSANFTLPDTATSNDKFILHLYPNNQAGRLLVRFHVFPIANPADSAVVLFDYTVTELGSSAGEVAIASGLEVFPNPASRWLNLRNNSAEALTVAWVSAQGQRTSPFQLLPGETKLEDLQTMPAGVCWILVKRGGRLFALPQVVGTPGK